MIGIATLNDGLAKHLPTRFSTCILRSYGASRRRHRKNIEQALTYATTQLLPLLTRIWPIPDDLVHAAGLGDLSRLRCSVHADDKPALGDLACQTPATSEVATME